MQPDPDRILLHEQIAAQQQRAQALKAELERLLARIEQANSEKAERERALSDAQQQLSAVMQRTEHPVGSDFLRRKLDPVIRGYRGRVIDIDISAPVMS